MYCIIVNSTFANNHGSGILIDRVTVIFTEGHSIVANNSSPTDGGGIFLSENSYLTTSNGGHVSFINNTANRYGGAIYSPDNDYTSLRSKILYHTYLDQCTVYNLYQLPLLITVQLELVITYMVVYSHFVMVLLQTTDT